jgi:hypothetical protein
MVGCGRRRAALGALFHAEVEGAHTGLSDDVSRRET